MFYPAMASVHAEARYNDLLREAEAERQIKAGRPARLGASLQGALWFLARLVLGLR